MSRLLVTQYQAEVEKIIQYRGSLREPSIRNAFAGLPKGVCAVRSRTMEIVQKMPDAVEHQGS